MHRGGAQMHFDTGRRRPEQRRVANEPWRTYEESDVQRRDVLGRTRSFVGPLLARFLALRRRRRKPIAIIEKAWFQDGFHRQLLCSAFDAVPGKNPATAAIGRAFAGGGKLSAAVPAINHCQPGGFAVRRVHGARLVVCALLRRGEIGRMTAEGSVGKRKPESFSPQAWGSISAAGPSQGGNCAPSGGAKRRRREHGGSHSTGAFLARRGLEAFPHRCRWRGAPDSAHRRQVGGRSAYAVSGLAA